MNIFCFTVFKENAISHIPVIAENDKIALEAILKTYKVEEIMTSTTYELSYLHIFLMEKLAKENNIPIPSKEHVFNAIKKEYKI